jgi:hypothetical protein
MKELNCASSFLSSAMASVYRSMLAGSRAERSRGLRGTCARRCQTNRSHVGVSR